MKKLRKPINGLYAITPDESDSKRLVNQVRLALRGGARVIQYRNKKANAGLRLTQATALLKLCREFSAPLIINDDLDLACEIDADGLHLGKEDIPFNMAREKLGPEKIVGVSCYNQLDLAITSEKIGADYVAFGSFFSSSTKPQATPAPLSLLHLAKQKITIPIVAIGGITVDNAVELIKSGADAVAVISNLFEVSDIEIAARDFSELFRGA